MSYKPMFVERLEDRRLMSAVPTPGMAIPGLFPIEHVQGRTVAAAAAPDPTSTPTPAPSQTPAPPFVPPAPGTRSTRLLGHWEGEVETKIVFVPLEFSSELIITGQTDTTLTGTVSIRGNDVSGTFQGRINPRNGRFRYTLRDDDATVTITGRLGPGGQAMSGKIRANYDGFKAKGDFDYEIVR